MNEICKYLEVDINLDRVDNGEAFPVENCDVYDAALHGFYLVCPVERREGFLSAVNDVAPDIYDYVADSIDSGKYQLATGLVRSTLHLQSFTAEFVADAGSIQDFFDQYGEYSPTTEFTEIDATEEPSPSFEFDCLSAISDETDVKDIVDNFESSVLEDMVFSGIERNPEETGGITRNTKENEVIHFPSRKISSGSAKQINKECNPVKDTHEEHSNVAEHEIHQNMQEAINIEPEALEILLASPDSTDEESVEEPVDFKDGLLVDGATTVNGKVIVEFSKLSTFISSLMKAVSEIEENSNDVVIPLTKDELADAAAEVDRYAPSVVKDFLLKYVQKANSNVELMRVTVLLDDFCTYVHENKSERF